MEGFVRGTILFQWPWRCTEHPNMIWIIPLRSVPIFSTIDNRKVIYSFFFYIQFFFTTCWYYFEQHVLAFTIEKKITLAKDVCSKPLITIKFHDLHVGDIRGVMGEITSYDERDQLSPFFSSYGLLIFWTFFGLPFCLPCDGSNHRFLLNFLSFKYNPCNNISSQLYLLHIIYFLH